MPSLAGFDIQPWVGQMVVLTIGLLLIRVVVAVVHRSANRRIDDSTGRYRARKLVTAVGYVIAIALTTVVFSNQLGNVAVALGVAGAGIAFALQEVVVSVAGWVAILVGRFYTVGDRVQLGGIRGDVIDIGVLRTTLMELGEWVAADQYSGRIVRLANSFVFKEPVFNYSADFPFLWDEIRLPIRYGSDYGAARAILLEIADEVVGEYATQAHATWEQMVRKYAIEPARVTPSVTAVANDNWVELTLRFVVDHKLRRSTKDELYLRALERFRAAGDSIQLASATVEVVGAPRLSVSLDGDMRGTTTP